MTGPSGSNARSRSRQAGGRCGAERPFPGFPPRRNGGFAARSVISAGLPRRSSPSERRLVGEVVVSEFNPFNALRKGAGEMSPLKRNGYFEQRPHLPDLT